MASYVDDRFVADVQGRVQGRLGPAANVIIVGPGLGQTDEYSAVVTFSHNGRQHHRDIPFRVADRSAVDLAMEMTGQIVRWMQEVSGS
jgi:hypothetical protein